MRERPIIGIVAGLARARSGICDRASCAYAESVLRAGGLPVILPNLADAQTHYVRLIRGLILTGGDNDIHPERYGERCLGSRRMIRAKDESDLAWAALAHARGLPILGICRGMQVINIFFGGTLRQHIDSHLDYRKKCCPVHGVTLSGSRILPDSSSRINSIHHQAVEKIGKGLLVTGRADDGTIEFIEHKKFPLAGAQWHPELLPDSPLTTRLFAWLMEETIHAKRRK